IYALRRLPLTCVELEAKIKSHGYALGPKVATGPERRRIRWPAQNAVAVDDALAEVDVAVNLIAGANDLVPVQEVVASEDANMGRDEPVNLHFYRRNDGELIGDKSADVAWLREEAARKDAVRAARS